MPALLAVFALAWGEAPASALPADATAEERPKRCSDGIDNDGDGLTDFGADPDCSSSTDNSEAPELTACGDGADNDADGRIDAADPGCSSPDDDSEADPQPEPPAPRCSDGADNDGDGRIDAADPGCSSPSDDSEADPAPETTAPRCSDGTDNDGDGRIDAADPGCSSPSDDSETDATPPQEPPAQQQTPASAPGPAPQPAGGTLGVVTVSEPETLAPFPIVRLQGRLTRSGVRVTRLQVRAPRGATVVVGCRGRGCPLRRVRRVSGTALLRIRPLERRLRAGISLDVSITKLGWIGKYTGFRIVRGRAPIRRDACLAPGITYPVPCDQG